MTQKAKPYINPLDDGRRKIAPDQHPQIMADYLELQSLNKTAKLWNVSKKTILLIVNKDAKERMLQRNKEIQHYKIYYNKEKRREYMRKYREKKRSFGLLYTVSRVRT